MVKLIVLRLLESFFRNRWLNLLPVVVLFVAGVGVAFLVPPDYEATGTMMIEKDTLLGSLTSPGNSTSLYVTAAQLTVDELNELLATDAFVRSAIQKTSLEANMGGNQEEVKQVFDEFRRSLTVTSVGSKLIELKGTHGDPVLAQQVAASTIESYIQWQINKDYQQSVVAQNFFANLITPYQEDLQNARNGLRDYLESYPEPLRGQRPPEEAIEIDRLQGAISLAEQRVAETLKNEESARLALAKAESLTRQTYIVIDTPVIPEKSFSLRGAIITIIIFAFVGAFLSAAAVVGGALLDPSLRFPVDVKHALHLPVLATVALDKGLQPKGAKKRVAKDARQTNQGTEASAKPGAVNPGA
jgi:capsular polysaccharide biosynthesis protein